MWLTRDKPPPPPPIHPNTRYTLIPPVAPPTEYKAYYVSVISDYQDNTQQKHKLAAKHAAKLYESYISTNEPMEDIRDTGSQSSLVIHACDH